MTAGRSPAPALSPEERRTVQLFEAAPVIEEAWEVRRIVAAELRGVYGELWAKKDDLSGDLAGHVAFCALMIRDRADELDPQ